MKRRFQPPPTVPQQALRDADAPRQLRNLIDLRAVGRDWLSMRQLAERGLFPTAEAARKYVTRHRGDLVTGRKGRELLVDLGSLDRHLEGNALRRA